MQAATTIVFTGYAVFGLVFVGLNVVDKIKDVKTKALIEYVFEDVPTVAVVIVSRLVYRRFLR